MPTLSLQYGEDATGCVHPPLTNPPESYRASLLPYSSVMLDYGKRVASTHSSLQMIWPACLVIHIYSTSDMMLVNG